MYIQLILWEKCNMDCKYCHLGIKNPKTIINDNILENIFQKNKKLLEKEPNQDILLEFQGGEPLLYFDKIKQIVITYKKTFWDKVKFILTTNWTKIDNNILNFLKKNKHSISLNISFDWTDTITTENRTKNRQLTKTIINNIITVINNWIPITIIGTINKTWITETNNSPIKIKEYLDKTFNNVDKNKNVNYFFRPEILLDEKETYGIETDKIINFHTELSKLINNNYYSIKEELLEFNRTFQKNTICIDYNGTIYPNDYYKSYIKRYNKDILKEYENIFNIFNISNINDYNNYMDMMEKKKTINIKDKEFIKLTLNKFQLDILKQNINSDILVIKPIIINMIKQNLKKDYFIFNINKETSEIYKKID